jgi:hypothetical protein
VVILLKRTRWLLGLAVLSSLLVPAPPAGAAVSDPRPVTPPGVDARAKDQATDREGDTVYAYVAGGTFNLRILRRGGRLSRVLPLAPVEHVWSYFEVAVDNDGDGVAIWDQRPEVDDPTAFVFARRFSRSGVLGPLRRITPDEHWVAGAEIAVQPTGGKAVITWERITGDGYVPFVRTLSRRNAVGPVLKVGRGPDADAPMIAMARDGRATLVWTNNGLRARRMRADGSLSRPRMVRRSAFYDEALVERDIGIDRRGVITVACERNTRKRTGSYPPVIYLDRACVLRISPRLRLMGRVKDISPARRGTLISAVRLGVAPNGTAVATWLKHYQAGVWAVVVRRDGTLGESVKVAEGGIGDIVLAGDGDGVVTSQNEAANGSWRIRVTRVRNGHIRRTSTVGRAPDDVEYLRAGLTPGGRFKVSWNDWIPPARTWVVTGR